MKTFNDSLEGGKNKANLNLEKKKDSYKLLPKICYVVHFKNIRKNYA